ncbi:hypothetical protein KEM52_003877, partial [Ascosphaera acerosa]
RPLQDHLRHRPPARRGLPRARLRRRSPHQHLLDHPRLHPWHHPRAVRGQFLCYCRCWHYSWRHRL